MKSYGVTIQMKPLQQYFHKVLFVSQHFTKSNLEILLNFHCVLGERVKQRYRWNDGLEKMNSSLCL